ncbi:flagellar FlbD family protein [Nocardioides sp.]|uniref:flagellar FlbD family protein n=1 Tax=Nocardioides sp. TaxID=35761 RepID=UPI002735AB80|nr:flagellar FlbD family protein [Nocardioides sp.]MDP3890249.1 flagellar FlbD family protein [Nocardioides sp.]
MIAVTRLSGSVFVLNADLIERVDATPDTVITLVDGKKYVVTESLAQVVAQVRVHRAEVIALSTRMVEQDNDPAAVAPAVPRLTAVTTRHQEA